MWVEKHGPGYRIRDRVGGRVITVSKHVYPTKTSAKEAMKGLVADEVRGEALIPRGGAVTLAAFVDEWWPTYEKTLKPSSIDSEGARIQNHIVPLLGRYTLDELQDARLVQQWVNDLEAGNGPVPHREGRRKWKRRPLAPKSVHNAHGALHLIFAAAVRAKLIKVNPCAGTTLPRRVRKEMRTLSDPEIARLIRALPEHWRPLILLMVATGLRWGEAIGLKVGRVDLLAARPRLRVLEQLQETAGRGSHQIWVTPKSERSRRTVSFPVPVAHALAPLVAGKGSDDVVFTTVTGRWVRTRNFRRIWVAAIEKAGLEGLRIHDLRHTHAAILISAGRPLTAISRRLGHASVAVTDMIYGHLREEVDEGILAAIEEAMMAATPDELAAEVAAELVDEMELAA